MPVCTLFHPGKITKRVVVGGQHSGENVSHRSSQHCDDVRKCGDDYNRDPDRDDVSSRNVCEVGKTRDERPFFIFHPSFSATAWRLETASSSKAPVRKTECYRLDRASPRDP